MAVMTGVAFKKWSYQEDRVIEDVYPTGGPAAAVRALAAKGYMRTYSGAKGRARVLGVQFIAYKQRREYKREYKRERLDCSSPETLNRPLTPASVEMIHWYATKGYSPRKTAEDINRPVEVVERVLRETPQPPPGRDNLWPSSYADWGLA